MSLLTVQDLVAGYEPGLPILRGASIAVDAGEIVVLLGPNGAGKSTLAKAIAGLVPVFSGTVTLDGADLTARPAHRMAATGLGFVPQTENVFPRMSVADNLRVAGGRRPAAQVAQRLDAMFALFPDLARQRHAPAGALSGGQRQMLAVARALVVPPRVLMLDEPSAGLSPAMAQAVFADLARLRAEGLTLLLVEQNVRPALALGDRAYVLAEGRVAHEGPAATLADDPLVAELYLGGRRP